VRSRDWRATLQPHPWLHAPASWPERVLPTVALLATYSLFTARALGADPASQLSGDGAATALAAAKMAAPMVLLSLLPWRWPRLLGAIAGALLVPWGWLHATAWVTQRWQLWMLSALTLFLGASLGRPTAMLCGAAWLSVLLSSPPALPRPPPAAVPRPDTPPLVLITLDTLRADHVSRTGEAPYARLTPHLDALADRGVLWTEGVAPAPLTGPSHAGMLTGQFPPGIGIRRNGDRLDPAVATVATELHDAGWRTGAFLASGVLDRRVGLARGFDHYDDRFGPSHRLRSLPPHELLSRWRWIPRHAQRPGDDVVQRALTWLKQDPAGARGTFLWVHLYDAHSPYEPEVPASSLYPTDPGRGHPAEVRAWQRWRTAWFRFRGLPGLGMRKPIHREMANYAAEVHEVDALVGQLLAALPTDARIVVASDHGESLTEHGYAMNHGRHTFQATLRVPLWAVGPGLPPGTQVHDAAPSWLVGGELRRLAGLPTDTSLQGTLAEPWPEPIESFTPGQEARPALLLGPAMDEMAVRIGPDKWITGFLGTLHFDLATDPDERWPQVSEGPPGLPDPRERLRELDKGPDLDRDTETWLEALGYSE